jgi:hypothetical protein
MLFNDLYVGVPPGQPYPDLTEIIRLTCRLTDKTIELDCPIGLDLESDMNKEIDIASRIYS